MEDKLSEEELAVMKAAESDGSVRTMHIAEYAGEVVLAPNGMVGDESRPVYKEVLDGLVKRGFLSGGPSFRPTEEWRAYNKSHGLWLPGAP